MKSKYTAIIFSALVLSILGGVQMDAQAKTSSIERFTQVDKDIYRGAQPLAEGYDELKAMGIKTVINFRHEDEWVQFGEEQTSKRGIKQVSYPWTIFGDNPNYAQFIQAIDESEKPLFFHCRRGVERTGVMHWIYARDHQGMTEKESEAIALKPYPLKWFWKPFVTSKIDAYKTQSKKSQLKK